MGVPAAIRGIGLLLLVPHILYTADALQTALVNGARTSDPGVPECGADLRCDFAKTRHICADVFSTRDKRRTGMHRSFFEATGQTRLARVWLSRNRRRGHKGGMWCVSLQEAYRYACQGNVTTRPCDCKFFECQATDACDFTAYNMKNEVAPYSNPYVQDCFKSCCAETLRSRCGLSTTSVAKKTKKTANPTPRPTTDPTGVPTRKPTKIPTPAPGPATCRCVDERRVSCTDGRSASCTDGQVCSDSAKFPAKELGKRGCRARQVWCECEAPGDGQNNKVLCGNTTRWCAAGQECFSVAPFPYGQWSRGCRPRTSSTTTVSSREEADERPRTGSSVGGGVTCSCMAPGEGKSKNGIRCSNNVFRSCRADEECYTENKIPWGNWGRMCRKVVTPKPTPVPTSAPTEGASIQLSAESMFTGMVNVASRKNGGQPFASGSLKGYCSSYEAGLIFVDEVYCQYPKGPHCYSNINDGKLGNNYSWVPGPYSFNHKHWVGVKFRRAQVLSGIRVSRGGRNRTDRIGGTYSVEVSTSLDAPFQTNEWTTLGVFRRSHGGFHWLRFSNPVEALAVRIVVSDKTAAIDELEAYSHWNDMKNIAAVGEGGLTFASGSARCSSAKPGILIPHPAENAWPEPGQVARLSGAGCYGNVNDGEFGASHAWSPGPNKVRGEQFVGVRFKELSFLHGVSVTLGAFSGARSGIGGTYKVYTSVNRKASHATEDWTLQGEFVRSSPAEHTFKFPAPVEAFAVKIVVSDRAAAIAELAAFTKVRFPVVKDLVDRNRPLATTPVGVAALYAGHSATTSKLVYPSPPRAGLVVTTHRAFASMSNVASQRRGALPFASGALRGGCNNTGPGYGGLGKFRVNGTNCFYHINDGQVAEPKRAWVAGGGFHNSEQFVGIDFVTGHHIAGVRISFAGEPLAAPRSHGERDDRQPYTLQVTSSPRPTHNTPASKWTTIGTFRRQPGRDVYLTFGSLPHVRATGIRLVLRDSKDPLTAASRPVRFRPLTRRASGIVELEAYSAWPGLEDLAAKSDAIVGSPRAFASGSREGACTYTLPGMGGAGHAGPHCYSNLIDGNFGHAYAWAPSRKDYNGKHFAGVIFASEEPATSPADPAEVHGLSVTLLRADAVHGDIAPPKEAIAVFTTDDPLASFSSTKWTKRGTIQPAKSNARGPLHADIRFREPVTGVRAVKLVLADHKVAVEEFQVFGKRPELYDEEDEDEDEE